nr:hypothetical protein [Serratia marcescens]
MQDTITIYAELVFIGYEDVFKPVFWPEVVGARDAEIAQYEADHTPQFSSFIFVAHSLSCGWLPYRDCSYQSRRAVGQRRLLRRRKLMAALAVEGHN